MSLHSLLCMRRQASSGDMGVTPSGASTGGARGLLEEVSALPGQLLAGLRGRRPSQVSWGRGAGDGCSLARLRVVFVGTPVM